MSCPNLRFAAFVLSIFFVVFTAGCQDDSVAPPGSDVTGVDPAPTTKVAPQKVVFFATVTSVGDDELIVMIPKPIDPDVAGDVVWSEALPGRKINRSELRVGIDPAIVVDHGDGDWSDLQPGSPVMIAGDLTLQGMNARFIFDPRAFAPDPATIPDITSRGTWESGPPLSLPMPHEIVPGPNPPAFGEARSSQSDTKNFPGQFGGPSWTMDTGPDDLNILVFTAVVTWVFLDRIRPTVGLGGGHYNFPFEFSVENDNTLVVGQSDAISVQVEPRSPDDGDYSYFWALGINIEFTFSICVPFLGCEDFPYDLSLLSTVNATSDKAPMENEELEVEHHACPEIPVIAIPETPISALGILVCQDQTFIGHDINARVDAHGLSRYQAFHHQPEAYTVQPTTNPMVVALSELTWEPDFAMGISLGISVFTVPVYDFPGIPVAEGPMSFIPTARASCNYLFDTDTCGDDQPSEVMFTLPTIPVVTSVTAQPTPTRYGETVRLRAYVRGANGPGDSPKEVAFFDGDVQLATAPIDGADYAILDVSTLEPCRHVLTARYVGVDEEGVTYPSEKSVVAIVTNINDETWREGYWQHQARGNGLTDFDEEEMTCYLAIADELSRVFGEIRDVSTVAAGCDVLFMAHNHGSALEQLDRELLVAWLNFANGAYAYGQPVDIDGDRESDISFHDLMIMIEDVRLDPAATDRAIRNATRILHNITGTVVMPTVFLQR